MKHTSDDLDLLFRENESPCDECGALPGQDHKSWCLNRADESDGNGAIREPDLSGDLDDEFGDELDLDDDGYERPDHDD